MRINEEKLEMWCKQVDRRLDGLERKMESIGSITATLMRDCARESCLPEPEEPKLEGEVREIVRHWANLHGYNCLSVVFIKRGSERIFSVVSPDATRRIEFSGAYVADDFDAGRYTINELCGEDDE
jgi:hypothetical protein